MRVQATRRFRIFAERKGTVTNASLIKLMGMLQRLQQFMVSPLLAENGAAGTKANEQLIERWRAAFETPDLPFFYVELWYCGGG